MFDDQTTAVHDSQALSNKNSAALVLQLEPEDWFWLPYREQGQLPGPAPAPFEQQQALQRLTKVAGKKSAWAWEWEKMAIPRFPSAAEAHFWLAAMQHDPQQDSGAVLIARLAEQDFDGDLSLGDVEELLQHAHPRTYMYLVPLITAILQPDGMLALLLEYARRPKIPNQQAFWETEQALLDIRAVVLPYTSPEQRRAVSAQLDPLLRLSDWPGDLYARGPLAYYLAAMLGGHDQALLQLVESWPAALFSKDDWSDYYQQPQQIVFGLQDARELVGQMRRLKLRLKNAQYMRAWLAHTGFAELDWARDSILAVTNKDGQAGLIETLGRAIGPQTAPIMLELLKSSRAPAIAAAWLDAHPTHTITGLLPVAAGQGKLSAAALEVLRGLGRRGLVAQIEAAMKALPAEQAAWLQQELLDAAQKRRPVLAEADAPDWLREGLVAQPDLKLAKGTSWLEPELLPDIVVGEQRLDEQLSFRGVQAMQRSPLEQPHALLAALKQHADADALAAFAWAVFQQWLQAGAPGKDIWAMQSLAVLGNDQVATQLAALVRIWPGEGQHKRAVTGIDVLGALGSDVALMQINGIAEKLKFKALKEHAAVTMEQIAARRGLSREELGDRIVPDFGLQKGGGRIFDYGTRQFAFVPGPDLKPMIRDEQGKLKGDLPKPGTKDDAALAASAVAEWKSLKKPLAEALELQAWRLEQAMVTGRRWAQADFAQLLVGHPLLGLLVRRLVWGIYRHALSFPKTNGHAQAGQPGLAALSAGQAAGPDKHTLLIGSLRVSEDGSYVDMDNQGVSLPEGAQIGLIHRLELSETVRQGWVKQLSEQGILQPFQQLERETHTLEAGEREASEITRFNSQRISAAALVFGLDKRGWLRDLPADAGGFGGHSKQFLAANITAVVQYEEGVAIGYIADAPEQNLEYIAFVPGLQKPEYYPQHKDRLVLRDVDAIVVSEVLRDVTEIVSKA